MCVRDLIRGKCQVSKRTSKEKLRRSDNVSLCKSSSRRARRMKREEEIDLLCTENLSQGDANNQADISYLKVECEPVSPLMVGISSAFRAAVDPYLYSLLLSPESGDCNYFQQRHWTGIDREPSPFGYAQEIPMRMVAGDYRARDSRCWNDEGLIDGVDWHDFSPEERFSIPIATHDMWQCVEAETDLPFGNSPQSKSLPEEWAAQACGPFCHDKEQKSTELMASIRSRKKPEFKVSSEPFNITTTYHEGNSIRDQERISVTKRRACTVEFREVMEFLLKKESSKSYQLPDAYIERVTGKSGQKLEINEIQSTRWDFVKWILKVVEHLQLSLLTAAHAVSLFDRYLSQRLVLDAQIEDNEELLLSATACAWIAAKLEDSCVPHLSCIRALVAVGFDDVKFREMEVVVLSSLGWRTLGATANDYLANMIAQLPALGVPAHLLTSLGCRSEDVMRVLLPEVEFLAYQPSVVSFSVMQCLLDEYVPVQTASLMATFHLALAVDVESKEDCNRALKNIMNSTQASVLQAPARGCAELKKYNDLHSDSCNPDTWKEQSTRLPISAF